MQEDAYRAPQAELIDDTTTTASATRFYVIPSVKFWTFNILTFGLFMLPWNYLHWTRIKHADDSDIWPVARALFSIFFIYRLFEDFDESRAQTALPFKWSPAIYATLYILFVIAANLPERMFGSLALEFETEYWLVLLICSIAPIWLSSRAQRVANLAAGDKHGDSNKKWTVSNYIWVGIGVIWWGLVVGGLLFTDSDI